MLAVNGFDCRDAYLLKRWQDPWIHMAVYKTETAPMDPAKTSWLDLIDAGLLHPSVEGSINRNGHLKQEEIVMPWLDRENYFIDYVSDWTEIPEGAEHSEHGVRNVQVESKGEKKALQNVQVKKETPKPQRVGLMRPPKIPFTK
jgi:hypothetical protein